MPKASRPSGLTAKQERFVAEYLKDCNATRAAEAAGYSSSTRGALQRYGCELLKKPAVRNALAKAMKKQEERTLITADQVLLDIQAIGDEALKAKDFTQALRSRELLGKRYKLFTDKVEVVGTVPRAERLRAARLRRQRGDE